MGDGTHSSITNKSSKVSLGGAAVIVDSTKQLGRSEEVRTTGELSATHASEKIFFAGTST